MKKNIIYSILLVVISSIVGILLAELAVRGFVSKEKWAFRDATTDFISDDTLGWRQKENLNVIYKDEVIPIIFKTNSDGIRPDTAKRIKKQGVYRIMLVGNSTVVGRAVNENNSVHYFLDSMFKQLTNKPIEIYNAGVQGYSTDQVLAAMQHVVPLYQPNLVLYSFCDNDLGGNGVPIAYKMDKPYAKLRENNKIQLNIPKNKTVIRDNYGKGILRHSALWRMLRPTWLVIKPKILADDVELSLSNLSHNFKESYYENPKVLENYNFKLFAALLDTMNTYCISQHINFGFYAHPAIESTWKPFIDNFVAKKGLKNSEYNPYQMEQKLQHIADSLKIPFVPFVKTFLENQHLGAFHLFNDPHCNKNGYQLQAKIMSSFIVKNDSLLK